MEALEDGAGVQLQLGETHETFKAYPFWFLLTMEVRLAPGALEITAIVENRGNDTMPFSFGLHPYFNLSSLEGVRFEGCRSSASTTSPWRKRPRQTSWRDWPVASTCWCGPRVRCGWWMRPPEPASNCS